MAASKTDKAGTTATKKPNAALMKPLQPSNELAAVVGSSPLPRTEVVSKVWEYIKANNLQNPANKPRSWPMTSSGPSLAARTR